MYYFLCHESCNNELNPILICTYIILVHHKRKFVSEKCGKIALLRKKQIDFEMKAIRKKCCVTDFRSSAA